MIANTDAQRMLHPDLVGDTGRTGDRGRRRATVHSVTRSTAPAVTAARSRVLTNGDDDVTRRLIDDVTAIGHGCAVLPFRVARDGVRVESPEHRPQGLTRHRAPHGGKWWLHVHSGGHGGARNGSAVHTTPLAAMPELLRSSPRPARWLAVAAAPLVALLLGPPGGGVRRPGVRLAGASLPDRTVPRRRPHPLERAVVRRPLHARILGGLPAARLVVRPAGHRYRQQRHRLGRARGAAPPILRNRRGGRRVLVRGRHRGQPRRRSTPVRARPGVRSGRVARLRAPMARTRHRCGPAHVAGEPRRGRVPRHRTRRHRRRSRAPPAGRRTRPDRDARDDGRPHARTDRRHVDVVPRPRCVPVPWRRVRRRDGLVHRTGDRAAAFGAGAAPVGRDRSRRLGATLRDRQSPRRQHDPSGRVLRASDPRRRDVESSTLARHHCRHPARIVDGAARCRQRRPHRRSRRRSRRSTTR